MKRKSLLVVLVLIAALASCQDRLESPQTVAWDAPTDGSANYYEIAIQPVGTTEVSVVGNPSTLSFTVDLSAEGQYGRFIVMVRSVAVTDPDMEDRSEWIRSDADTDVITVDGIPRTFTIERKRTATAPSMLRIQ